MEQSSGNKASILLNVLDLNNKVIKDTQGTVAIFILKRWIS